MRIFLSIGIVLGLWSGAAFAQTAAERLACRGDFAKFCKGVEPGGGRVIACLGKYESKLSQDCRKVVEAHKK
jgi:hypothetical protein